MSIEAGGLSRTVTAMRPTVPAKDFEISKRFYIEPGFQPRPARRNAPGVLSFNLPSTLRSAKVSMTMVPNRRRCGADTGGASRSVRLVARASRSVPPRARTRPISSRAPRVSRRQCRCGRTRGVGGWVPTLPGVANCGRRASGVPWHPACRRDQCPRC
jgi:hypothetical protein